MSKGILILTRTLGDVVVGNTLAKNIRLNHPDITQLDYIVEEKYADLVNDNPNITNVRAITNTEQAWNDILRIVSCEGYDYIFMAQQTSSTDNCWHQHPTHNKKHILDFYAKRCNIKIIDPTLELFTHGALGGNWITIGKGTIALHNTSLVDVKNWDKFNELSQMLLEKGYNVVQLGHKNDKPILGANKIELSLLEIMQYLKAKQCKVFVGLDSGLSYVASAFNVPTIALYGATDSVTSGAYGQNTEIILAPQNEECRNKRSGIRCHGILQGKCAFGSKCINSISVEEVVNKIVQKLSKKESINESRIN